MELKRKNDILIEKLTSQSGLRCQACHAEESRTSPTPQEPAQTSTHVEAVKTESLQTPQDTAVKTAGFEIVMAVGVFLTGYVVRRR